MRKKLAVLILALVAAVVAGSGLPASAASSGGACPKNSHLFCCPTYCFCCPNNAFCACLQ